MLNRSSRLRVALLCSRRAAGLDSLLADPARGRAYDLVACLTTEDAFAQHALLQAHGVPCLRQPIHPFYRWQRAPLSDLGLRRDFDAGSLRLLEPHAPDLLVLASYLYVLTGPVLEAFPARIVNVHHSDLSRRGRGYPGLRAVRDAILAGEEETRATAHVVTDQLDAGPLLLRSWPFPVASLARQALAWGALDVVKTYASAHEEWMLRTAFGPLLAGAIALYAEGRVQVRDGAALVDGRPGPLDLELPPAAGPRAALEAMAS
ncbi:MAG TPA: formyltransferase family protein [Vicinamibacteria bacterium]|nr:formyltransferase family protein [Vicinamibacteria bacterium]